MAKKTVKSKKISSSKKTAAKQASKSASKPAPAKKVATSEKVKKVKLEPKGKIGAKKSLSRPAMMTAKGKIKSEPPPAPEEGLENKKEPKVIDGALNGKPIKNASPKLDSKDFENDGDQLIAMAKDEMSRLNRTSDSDKSGEKSSKFKSIKVERGNLNDEKAKWQELYKRYGKDKAISYKMSESFESLKPISHKVLGWGFVLTNDNNRLEVLFENGIKMLISNYKAT